MNATITEINTSHIFKKIKFLHFGHQGDQIKKNVWLVELQPQQCRV